MLRLGWFSTARGPGSRNLLREVMGKRDQGILDIEISFVFCNWDNSEDPNPRREEREKFFEMVRGYGIPLITLSWKSFRPDLWSTDQKLWRDLYGAEMRERISKYDFDLGILAGYMLWVDDETCSRYNLMNLHPALPTGPKGTWQEVIWQLMEEGSESQGAMMHIVTPDWDRGAALTYCEFPIVGGEYDGLWDGFYKKLEGSSIDAIKSREGTEEPLFRRIREDGARRELPLIVATIGQFADGTVTIKDKQLYKNGVRLDRPFDLSMEVDRSIGE